MQISLCITDLLTLDKRFFFFNTITYFLDQGLSLNTQKPSLERAKSPFKVSTFFWSQN